MSPFRYSIALVVIMLLFAMVSSAFAAAVALTPREAIERAIVDRMGGSVAVLVDVLRSDIEEAAGLEARPDPGARAGQPARFVLSSDGVQRGTAVASVRIETRYARAARVIERGEVLDADAVEIVTGELPDVMFRRVPAADAVAGLRARRTIATGEPLTTAVLEVPPVVQSGDEVTVTVSVGRALVSGTGIASGSGLAGDTIRVMTPGRRRLIPVRIVGPGAVEVVR